MQIISERVDMLSNKVMVPLSYGDISRTACRNLSILPYASVRTMDRLAGEISKRLMLDSATIAKALYDEAVCEKYGYDTATIACMFIPNTYDIYWNVSLDKLLDRMQKESKTLRNFERTAKAKGMKLTPNQVITLASIVDEETANNAEKPMVAGMYYNRLTLRNAEYRRNAFAG